MTYHQPLLKGDADICQYDNQEMLLYTTKKKNNFKQMDP